MVSLGNPEAKGPLGRRRGREVDIKTDVKEMGSESVWPGLIWLRIGTSGRQLGSW